MILSQLTEMVKLYFALPKPSKLQFYCKLFQTTLQEWDFLSIRFFSLFENNKIDFITWIVLFNSF